MASWRRHGRDQPWVSAGGVPHEPARQACRLSGRSAGLAARPSAVTARAADPQLRTATAAWRCISWYTIDSLAGTVGAAARSRRRLLPHPARPAGGRPGHPPRRTPRRPLGAGRRQGPGRGRAGSIARLPSGPGALTPAPRLSSGEGGELTVAALPVFSGVIPNEITARSARVGTSVAIASIVVDGCARYGAHSHPPSCPAPGRTRSRVDNSKRMAGAGQRFRAGDRSE